MLYRKELKKLNTYKPGKPIEEVKRSLGISKVYKLASNEVPFSPDYVYESILKELKNINRYPLGDCFYLQKALAKKLKVEKDQLVFGNGSDELIVLSLRALVNKNEEVIVSYPTFLIYEIQAKAQGAKIIKVPARNLRYSLSDMAKKITKKTKIIFIANPDNPTGTYLTKKEIKDFIKSIPKNILVFFDEAYFEFAPEDFPKTLELLKNRGNIIITRTFSKAYGLAGLRVGYGITTKEIAAALNKVREPFNVNRLAQVSAIAALKNKSFVKRVVNHINKEKRYFYQEFDKSNLSYTASATNFILVNFKKNTEELCSFLLKKGVIVRDMKGWGLPNFFRVSVGKRDENRYFIKCLRQYLKQ